MESAIETQKTLKTIAGNPALSPASGLSEATEKADILLVDDSVAKLLTFETILADLGQNLIKATSGREALRQLLTRDFAVILLDVNMPDIDGFETAKLIRQRKRSEHTPIIFVSAISRTETHASLGYSLGAVDYIFTPIVPEVLRAKVSVFVDLFQKTREIQRQAEQLRFMERRAHERDLHGSRERISAIFKQTTFGIVQLDLSGKIVLANESFCRVVDRTPDDLVRKHISSLTHPEDTAEESVLLSRLFTGSGRDFVTEKRCLRPDGTLVWINSSATLICDVEGVPEAALVIVQDISERKFAEDQLIRHRDRLEELVAERTAQLQRSERLASIGTLAAGIAHEINNPLNAILATSQFATKFKEEMPPEQAFQTIINEVQRASRVVKGILKFAKDETTPKAEGNINEVVRHAAEMAKLYITSPGLAFQFNLIQNAPPVLMNQTELEQVLINLIKNASEASNGKVKVSLQTRRVGDDVHIVVEDNGPGIPAEVQSHVFDPFFSTTRHIGGSGLGLSISHGIISDHGGSISVHSEPGNGASFTIRLPIAPSHQE